MGPFTIGGDRQIIENWLSYRAIFDCNQPSQNKLVIVRIDPMAPELTNRSSLGSCKEACSALLGSLARYPFHPSLMSHLNCTMERAVDIKCYNVINRIPSLRLGV